MKQNSLKITLGCSCHFDDARTRFDPTGTTGIRRRFEADLTRRFRSLKGLIYQSIVRNDALGLGKFGMKDGVVTVVRDQALTPGKFAFSRSSEKVSGFMAWLVDQEDRGILGVTPGTPIQSAADNAWTNVYIESAYHKGVRDAGDKLRRSGANVAPTWIENAFTRPVHADRAGLAYTRAFSQLKGITDTMDQQISGVLANGLSQGKGPMQIARDINDRVDKIGITRARVIARTEVINAHAEATLNAYEEAGVMGVEVESEFTTAGDDAVCPECDALSGKTYTLQEAQGVIPVHPNCLPGDSLVLSRSGISAASKRWFDGDLIVINSSSGRVLRCTPNHPVLTDKGWIAAQDVNLSHKVICDGGSEWMPGADNDHKNIVSSIHDVSESFIRSGKVTPTPVPMSSEHFHGDGTVGEIAVVWSDGKLRYAVDASCSEFADNKTLNLGVVGDIYRVCLSSLTFFLKGMLSTSHGFVGSLYLQGSLGVCHSLPFKSFGFRFRPESDTPVLKPVIDSVSADAKLARKLIGGLSCKVFSDDVVSVEREFFSGHVYNLETGEGWYSANGIITHNCRCGWTPKVVNGTDIELV